MSQAKDQPQKPAVNILVLVPMLAVAAGMAPASLTMTSPSLPAIAASLGVSDTQITFSQVGFLVAMAVPQLLFGSVSDKFGRRPPFLIGVVLFILGSIMCMTAPNFEVLTIGRMAQAFGASSGMVTSRSLLRELFPESKAASLLGYVTVGIMVIPMLAPALGGYLQASYGWRYNFAFLTGLGCVVLVISYLFVPRIRTQKPDKPRSHFNVYRRLIQSQKFRGYALQFALVSASNQVFFACIPFVAEDHFHLEPSEYGKYFAIPAFGYMIGNFISGRLAQRLGIDKLIKLGSSLFMILSVILLLVMVFGQLSPLTLFGIMAFISLSQGMIIPNAIAGSTGALEESYGSAAGFSGFLQTSGGAIAVLSVMPFLWMGPSPVIMAVTLCGLLSFIGFWFLMSPVSHAKPDAG